MYQYTGTLGTLAEIEPRRLPTYQARWHERKVADVVVRGKIAGAHSSVPLYFCIGALNFSAFPLLLCLQRGPHRKLEQLWIWSPSWRHALIYIFMHICTRRIDSTRVFYESSAIRATFVTSMRHNSSIHWYMVLV